MPGKDFRVCNVYKTNGLFYESVLNVDFSRALIRGNYGGAQNGNQPDLNSPLATAKGGEVRAQLFMSSRDEGVRAFKPDESTCLFTIGNMCLFDSSRSAGRTLHPIGVSGTHKKFFLCVPGSV